MKRHLFSVVMLFTTLIPNVCATDISYIWDVEKSGDIYTFDLSFYSPPTNKQSVYLELSKYADFLFVEKAVPFSSSPAYQCKVSASDIPEGEYYYRASVYTNDTQWSNFKAYAQPTNTTVSKVIGTKKTDTASYIPTPDMSAYGNVALSDGEELSIESIWLRSGLNGLPLMPTTPPGLDPTNRTKLLGTMENYANPPFDSFSHGVVVNNTTIYIGVGASCNFHPVVKGTWEKESLNSDPDRVMLYRYDLITGEFHSPVRIYNESGKDFEYSDYAIMPWLLTDDMGTPYFLSTPRYSRITAMANSLDDVVPGYSLDFSKIKENPNGIATLNATPFKGMLDTYDESPNYLFGIAKGNISSEDYRLWGMEYKTSASNLAAERWTTSFNTWLYNSAYTPGAKVVDFIEYPFSTVEDLSFSSYTPKVYPIDDTHVYTHATPALVCPNTDFTKYANYEPAFYEVEHNPSALQSKHGSATLKNKLSDAIKGLDIAPASDTKRMSGFPIIKIGNATIAAYGHLSDNGEATAVQLIQIKDPTLGFEEGNIVPLWDLFKETGLSTSLFQALDMTFIPAEEWSGTEVARASDANLVGHLLVYAAGAGMGLYKITSEGDDSVNSVIQINDKNPIEITNNSIVVNSNVNSVDIIDMQGRIIRHYDMLDCGTYSLPTLGAGIYILRTPSTAIKFAI